MSKMSEQDWSPEPWSYDGDPDGPLIVDANHRPATDNDADIYRAVACVNAMAGIPDPAALVESHAELLTWAKEYHGAAILMGMGYGDRFDKMIARAEAARGRK